MFSARVAPLKILLLMILLMRVLLLLAVWQDTKALKPNIYNTVQNAHLAPTDGYNGLRRRSGSARRRPRPISVVPENQSIFQTEETRESPGTSSLARGKSCLQTFPPENYSPPRKINKPKINANPPHGMGWSGLGVGFSKTTLLSLTWLARATTICFSAAADRLEIAIENAIYFQPY